jgi:hypothetical protein
MKRGRYQIGAEMRQQAIDYILANPGAAGPAIVAALGWNASIGATRLQDMTVAGELRRSPTKHYSINKLGRSQSQNTYAYWAVCEKTKSAGETVERVTANLNKKKEQAVVPQSKKQPSWVTRNDDPNRKPIRNQGGQGNIGQRVRGGSSLGV